MLLGLFIDGQILLDKIFHGLLEMIGKPRNIAFPQYDPDGLAAISALLAVDLAGDILVVPMHNRIDFLR
jgi:hypothetical protein